MKKLLSFLLIMMLVMPFACAEATYDRAGNEVTLPENPATVVCMNTAVSQMLEDLGLLDRVVACDTYSPLYVPTLAELPQYDMMAPDVEQIAALNPDLVIVTSMSFTEGDNPYQALIDMGVCVAVVPSSGSIEEIKQDILFVASAFGMQAEGQALVDEMQQTIDEIAAIGATITEKKTVFFEIGALPYLYSFGTGTFLDEMITIIGATNVMGDQESWVSVSEESAVAANPDIILTSVDYIEDPIGEILARPGWESVTAISNGDVHYIDTASSSLANEHIVDALIEMAVAVYPEAYASFAE